MNMDNVDQHLIHQFSCLGTTDKDDLVKQLQKLLAGSQLNETTAAFFLDMNNWWDTLPRTRFVLIKFNFAT